MSDLLALAERVEAATGPDRELDVAILTHPEFGYRDVHGDGSLYDRGNDGYWYTDDCEIRQLPSPTGSLDAATMLVPEGKFSEEDFKVERWNSNGVHAEHVRASAWVPGAARVYAATPALALTAAALNPDRTL